MEENPQRNVKRQKECRLKSLVCIKYDSIQTIVAADTSISSSYNTRKFSFIF